MTKTLLSKFDFTTFHLQSPAQFEQYKIAIIRFINDKVAGSLTDKFGEALPFSSPPRKTKADLYRLLTNTLIGFHEQHKNGVSEEEKTNHIRFFRVVQSIIRAHPDVLTPALFNLWSAVEWRIFLDRLYQNADLELASVNLTQEGDNPVYNMKRIQRIKLIFEKFQTLIEKTSRLIPRKETQSDSNLDCAIQNSASKTRHTEDPLHVEIEHRSSKKRQKLRHKSASVAMLAALPEEWKSLYYDMRLSLNSLNAALEPNATPPQAPSFETDMDKLNELAHGVEEVVKKQPAIEKESLLALDIAEMVHKNFAEVKGFDHAHSYTSIEALNYKLSSLNNRKNELSLRFAQQDTPVRKLKIHTLMNKLKQDKTIINEKIVTLNKLIEEADKKRVALKHAWKTYESQQKTILPHIRKQKEQQQATVATALAALVKQKKSLIIALNKKRITVLSDISELEATKTEEGYPPIKMCNALIAFFQEKLTILMCKKQNTLNELKEQKAAFLANWADVENEANRVDGDEQQLFATLLLFERGVRDNMQKLMQTKDDLVSQKREVEKKMAEISQHDTEAKFNYQPINQALTTLDEEIQALQTKIQHLHHNGIDYKHAKRAKTALQEMLMAARENLKALPLPTPHAAAGIFNHYQQQMTSFNEQIQEAYAAKQTAIANLRREINIYTHTFMEMFNKEKNASLVGTGQFFNESEQGIKHQTDNQLTYVRAVQEDIQLKMAECEQTALPKKRAQLISHIDALLTADIAPASQVTNTQPISRAFEHYQTCLTETRYAVLNAPDFSLSKEVKEGYLNRLRDIHQGLQGSLKTELDKLECEASTAHEDFVLAINRLKRKLTPCDDTKPCLHPAKGWAEETGFFIFPSKEKTAKIKHQIDNLTAQYITQKTSMTEQRAALYNTHKNKLDTAITSIHAVSNEAKNKIATNQRSVLNKLRRAIFYTSLDLTISSPVLVGVLEGLLAGFIAGMTTGAVGLPFWLAAGAIVGGAVGFGVSTGSVFFARKARQVAQTNILLQRREKALALEQTFKASEFNLVNFS
ncbi:MAG: hypothetical protein HKM04_02475 [Legionellales bacterium]|nr:hypothetical protein [Legionellales bacterium]